MATAHNEANLGDIAKTVIMSGDPLRVKKIADNYLENVKLVNKIRNIYAYTGTYKGKEITIMAHGMGMPSAGIYVYELYKFYGVEKIIRLGSCGTYVDNINLLDIILVDKSYTESNYAYTLNNEHVQVASSSENLNRIVEKIAKRENINIVKGNVCTTDCFDWYMTDLNKFLDRIPKELNIVAAEMESFAIFYIANLLKKEAACILTVVDSHYKKQELSAEERQNSIDKMTILALESII
ncbi:MAG: purine-nucleoside phosphorylase [Bacilli bacterium]|nr:purine-nucleoside phosphorylase [Bacilli bacterium]